jgi:Spy/CpxP family protein refolding chaperone
MKKWIILLILSLSYVGLGRAQVQPPPGEPPEPPAEAARVHELLIPPALIVRNQRALRLTGDQRSFIIEQIRDARSRHAALRWDLEDEMEQLAALVEQSSAEEGELVAQLDRVLDAEREIKRAMLLLAVRVRNILTPEQLEMLKKLERRPWRRPERPPRPPLQAP